MEADMAPPHKRRRVWYDDQQHATSSSVDVPKIEPTAAHSHGVEHLPPSRSMSSTHSVPQRIEEVHQIIQQTVIPNEYARLYPRQGTGTTSGSTLTVSISAGVNEFGSTTALVTVNGIVPGYVATETTTLTGSTASPGSAPSSTSQASVSSPSSSDSGSNSNTQSATSSQNGSSPSSTAPSNGFIGNSPGGTAASSTISSSSSNSTVPPSPTGSSLGPGSSGLSSSSANVTNSDISNSTSLAPDTASNASLGAFAYLTTLSDHSVRTISRSSRPYVTTFPDGEVATIGAFSDVVTTDSRGSISTYLTTASPSSPVASQSTVTNTAIAGAGYTQSTITSTAASSTSSAASNSNNNNSPPPAGTIAGGVVGGAAGLAVVLLIAMLFLRWYRRRAQMGHQALPPSSVMSSDLDEHSSSRQPGMAERAGLIPLMGAVPGMFRHQDRSREMVDAQPQERGFARVSGRKLPSQFSPGMSSNSPPPDMPLTGRERNLSATSFYRDSRGFYGGEGDRGPSPVADPSPTDGVSHGEQMTLSPGPQRRPTVHHGGPYVMSPTTSGPASPRATMSHGSSPPGTAATAATFARSDTPTSFDANRSSRFAEDV